MARSYTMLTEDTTWVMGRLKAVFRGRGHANHAPAPSLAAAHGGWMSENHPYLRRGESIFS